MKKLEVKNHQLCLYSTITKTIFFFGCKAFIRLMKKYWLAALFLFSLTVNYATFVSNDKVNERIFQRELALPELFFFFFQRPDKLEQFGKRPQASWMIVSHANNHLLTLTEFASDKANYHLKMSSKTLWAKSLHHDSQLYYNRYVTARTYTQNAHKHAQTHTALNRLRGWKVCLCCI